MKVRAIKTQVFREKEDLVLFVSKSLKRIPDRSVIVITSKIVSLSEGRVAPLHEKERLIQKESKRRVRTSKVWLTVKDGIVIPNAGIDESNGNGKLILLPRNSGKTAAQLQEILKKFFRVKHLGVIISDSVVMPMRSGVVGVALGYAGFKGVRDYRGKKDIYGRTFKFSKSNIADSLATAAMLVMGEGDERKPLAVIRDAPVDFSGSLQKYEMRVNAKDDLYAPLLKRIS